MLTKEGNTTFVSLDADHMGELLVVLADYHGYINNQVELDNLGAQDGMDTVYLLGNIEGRMLGNKTTEGDLEMIELWREEMDIYREEHGGTLFPNIVYGKEKQDESYIGGH